MNSQEKRQPLSIQEANEHPLQEKSIVFQEHFPTISEEELEKVTGGAHGGLMNPVNWLKGPKIEETIRTGATSRENAKSIAQKMNNDRDNPTYKYKALDKTKSGHYNVGKYVDPNFN